LLRIVEIVEESGTGFAFPQTLISADDGLQTPTDQSREAQVRQWRMKVCYSRISRRSR
jgi:hypothetical protein